MEIFYVYLTSVIGRNENALSSPTAEEKLYISSFYTNEELDIERVYTELNRFISQIVIGEEKELFFALIDSLLACVGIDIDYKIVDLLEPLMIAFKPRVSELLERSHLFCPCYVYKSGPINTWKNYHETVTHELELWKYIIYLTITRRVLILEIIGLK